MNIPALKQPKEVYSLAAVYTKIDEARKGFGKALWDLMNRQDQRLPSISYKDSDPRPARAQAVCTAMNKHYDETRRLIDKEMQKYLLEHDGAVDFWPDSVAPSVANWEGVESVDVAFDYFGDEFKVTTTGTGRNSPVFIIRKSEEFIYRNTFEPSDMPEYTKNEERSTELWKAMEKEKENRSPLITGVCLLVSLYLAYGLVCLLGDIFFGTNQALVKPLLDALPLPGFLYKLLDAPGWLHGALADMEAAGHLARGVYVTAMVIACGAVAFGALFVWLMAWDGFKSIPGYKKAKREYEGFIHGEEYTRVVRENEQWRKGNQELSEQWHRAWFDWVRTHKKQGGELSITAMKRELSDRHAEQRDLELRAMIKNDMGFVVPENVKAIDWMHRFTQGVEEKTAQRGAKDYSDLPPTESAVVMEEVLQEMREEGLI